jgi:hypothetical protein
VSRPVSGPRAGCDRSGRDTAGDLDRPGSLYA